jgi:hypothetical protein
MNWNLKQIMTPKLGGPISRFMKKKDNEINTDQKKDEENKTETSKEKSPPKRDK